MLIESERRRTGFRPGVSVILGDDNYWTLPAPSSLWPLLSASGPHTRQVDELPSAGLRDLLDAICEAEDQAEGQRAELALTIYLLMWNYDLKPEDFRRLLHFSPDDPRGVASRQVVHNWVEECMNQFNTVAVPAPRLEKKQNRFHRLVQLSMQFAPWSRPGWVVSRSRAEGR